MILLNNKKDNDYIFECPVCKKKVILRLKISLII
nr:MAG: Zn finger protein [uncultured archaeon]